MKIIDKINRAYDEDRCFWSFEYFPPKTQQGTQNLYDRIERMFMLGPTFIDVTWRAGGSSSDLTQEICNVSQNVYGLETCMHLTCTNMPKELVDQALEQCKRVGIQNILALRGDPPTGQERWTAIEGGFEHATDLVRYIRHHHGDYFCISVAGYPEGHIDCASIDDDIQHLKEKIDAGADYIVTQMFFDVPMYLKWVNKIRAAGITCPVLPGLLPVQNYNGFRRMTDLCKTIVPRDLDELMETAKDDEEAVKASGVNYMVKMCTELRAAGVRGFHFYTLNLEKSVRLILERLGFVSPLNEKENLPWKRILHKDRKDEDVRPIFWAHRVHSYITRTESWDDFPNGRWGSAKSPAFGDMPTYGVNSLKYPRKQALEMWGHPETPQDLGETFAKYITGEIVGLPWCTDPSLKKESDSIRPRLTELNLKGFLTINSQPAVQCAPSSHPRFGWGPSNGFVFQKAYLEFFVAPGTFEALIKRIHSDPNFTFYAVNRSGVLKTNASEGSVNAVTWGVFPGKEIVQPTIVEEVSFMAWKDEAFELWSLWSSLYKESYPKSYELIKRVQNEWILMNIVHHDFTQPGAIFKVFDGLEGPDETSHLTSGQGTEDLRVVNYGVNKASYHGNHAFKQIGIKDASRAQVLS